ncbi:MAG TPA: hypothetical protein PKD17_13790 [Cellvibrionaceae bacterium]|nr:hypothetical protein [Cellvibrionaceae bacterium]HMW72891.1 hypothetical protein [Cellvibrionaceae bacterium]HMY37960.1 hypothetical protein [Marinagarivorans sp.]HNG59819.1 hypothetical protein [Cellvibrionaceae bacterium]
MKSLIFIIAIFLGGCASVPMASLLELRSFSQDDFMRLQANDIRVKILVDEPVHAVIERTQLTLEATTQKGKNTYAYPLLLLNEVAIKPAAGFFNHTSGKTQYTLKLSDEGIKNVLATQQMIRSDRTAQLKFSINTDFEKLPAEVNEIVLTVSLRLFEQRGFITLFDNAKLSIKPEAN